MGMKVHVLYGKPTDPKAFEDYYRSTHAPIAEKLPGLQSFEYGKSMPNPDGTDAGGVGPDKIALASCGERG